MHKRDKMCSMTSFIIISKDKQKRIEYSKDFCAKQDINPFDISIIEKETAVKQNINSIGISEIKNIQKTAFLKPMKSKFKAVILEDAHLLTTEAQNAMLKILEEPPEHTLLLLGADTKEAFLPTILSRCQIIELETSDVKLTPKEQKDIETFITMLSGMPVGEKLKKAELLAKDKDKALIWIEKVIIVAREIMLKEMESQGPEKFVYTIRMLQSLHNTLKTTNVNPRFTIEHTLLQI